MKKTKILIVYYSTYGHVYHLAQAVKQGAEEVANTEVVVKRVPETLSNDILKKMGALEAQAMQASVPVCEVKDLADADAILFGTPTRFGNMCGQMRQFLDATGGLWQKGSLIGKIGSVFTSTASQHGGQESTLLSFHITLLHHGMVIAGLPYSFAGQLTLNEISGCSPYGASTIAGPNNERVELTANELAGAKFQGKHVATLAAKLTG